MGYKFEIYAANYPLNGYYQEHFQCETLWVALKKFREYRRNGYEIINVYYRDIKETFTWAFTEDE